MRRFPTIVALVVFCGFLAAAAFTAFKADQPAQAASLAQISSTGQLASTTQPASTANASPVPAAPKGWKTVFSDGFGGKANSGPSQANWFYDIGSGYGTGEIEQTTKSTKNVYVDGHGHLVLKALRTG